MNETSVFKMCSDFGIQITVIRTPLHYAARLNPDSRFISVGRLRDLPGRISRANRKKNKFTRMKVAV